MADEGRGPLTPQQDSPQDTAQAQDYEIYEEPAWYKNRFAMLVGADWPRRPQQQQRTPAGVVVRFFALGLDLLLCSPILWMLGRLGGLLCGLGFSPLLGILVVLFGLGVFLALAEWGFGATAGKALLGLRLESTCGDELRFSQCLFRETVGRLLSAVLLFGYLLALFDDRSRALHDFLADTCVVHR